MTSTNNPAFSIDIPVLFHYIKSEFKNPKFEMLNYIWLSLIVIGIGVAVYSDVNDISSQKYRNDVEYGVYLQFQDTSVKSFKPNVSYDCRVTLSGIHHRLPVSYQAFKLPPEIPQHASFIPTDNNQGILNISIDNYASSFWQERLKALRNPEFLIAHVNEIQNIDGRNYAIIKFDPIRFVKMNAVTNDGIIKYAKTAVELAIGLIGIMALWLGLMKIAEQSGLVAGIAKALRPITTRLFPDVPPDHPAMGAMIMNISANMLGLSNAATPLGLKAMEELNKLNKKAGTATDAMCTFLVINTGNVQLIPATVIAIRAAAGSANPTEILGPVLVATFLTLTISIVTVKLFAKLPFFKKQLEIPE
jgi:spore maturation protein A